MPNLAKRKPTSSTEAVGSSSSSYVSRVPVVATVDGEAKTSGWNAAGVSKTKPMEWNGQDYDCVWVGCTANFQTLQAARKHLILEHNKTVDKRTGKYRDATSDEVNKCRGYQQKKAKKIAAAKASSSAIGPQQNPPSDLENSDSHISVWSVVTDEPYDPTLYVRAMKGTRGPTSPVSSPDQGDCDQRLVIIADEPATIPETPERSAEITNLVVSDEEQVGQSAATGRENVIVPVASEGLTFFSGGRGQGSSTKAMVGSCSPPEKIPRVERDSAKPSKTTRGDGPLVNTPKSQAKESSKGPKEKFKKRKKDESEVSKSIKEAVVEVARLTEETRKRLMEFQQKNKSKSSEKEISTKSAQENNGEASTSKIDARHEAGSSPVSAAAASAVGPASEAIHDTVEIVNRTVISSTVVVEGRPRVSTPIPTNEDIAEIEAEAEEVEREREVMKYNLRLAKDGRFTDDEDEVEGGDDNNVPSISDEVAVVPQHIVKDKVAVVAQAVSERQPSKGESSIVIPGTLGCSQVPPVIGERAGVDVPDGDMEFGFVCGACGIKFVAEETYLVHTFGHASENKFECRSCGKVLPDRVMYSVHRVGCSWDLQAHKLAVGIPKGSNDAGAATCTPCGMEFPEKGMLVAHMAVHTRLHDLQCSRCFAIFDSPAVLHLHFFSCPFRDPGQNGDGTAGARGSALCE